MARPVYSVRVFGQAGFSGSLAIGPPPGSKLVIRDVDAYHGSSASPAVFRLEGNGGQTFVYWNTGFGFTGGQFGWRGRQVIEDGEEFTIRTDDAFDVTISGYLLTLP